MIHRAEISALCYKNCNKMNKIYFLLLYFFTQSLLGQSFIAKYQIIWQGYKVKNFVLIKNDSLSLWYVASKNDEKIKDTTVTFFGSKYNTYETTKISKPIYDLYDFKEFVLRESNKHQIIFTKILKNKRLFVRDTFFDMRWHIGKEFKIINGHKCQSAHIVFRGRNYKAFFAPDIPVNAGPWKFNNLPGLIVEVVSSDGEYQFRLNELKFKNKSDPIKLPNIPRDKIWNWKKYVTQVRNYYDDKIAYVRAKHREKNDKGGASIKISGIEIIHPIFSPLGVHLYEMKHGK